MKKKQINILNPSHRRDLYHKYGSMLVKSGFITAKTSIAKVALMSFLHRYETY